MPRWRCGGCSTVYAICLVRCPRCHMTTFHKESPMPKISRHAGPSNAGAAVPNPPASAAAPDQTEEEVAPVLWHCLDCTTAYAVGAPACPHCGSGRHADEPPAAPAPAVPEPVDAPALQDADDTEEGGESPSPGNSSSPSTPKQPTGSEPSKPSRPSRARKTASRSPKGRTASSSASGTAGGQTADTSEPDAEQPDEDEPAGA